MFTMTIFFDNGNQRYGTGSAEVITRWMNRYGIYGNISDDGILTVTEVSTHEIKNWEFDHISVDN